MHAFTDNEDRTWQVVINVAAVKRVRALLDVDLYGLVEDGFEPLAELIGDPVRLADVLYCLCQKEAEERNVSDEGFGRGLGGDVINAAVDAFVEELIDFFPDPKLRQQIRRVVQAAHRVRDKLLDHAVTLVDRIDMDQEASGLIASLTSSRASSGSTPDRSPSASS